MELRILTATEKMPATCRGNYGKVSLCLVEGEDRPKMISPRAKGMVKILRSWRKCNIGKTSKSAFYKAIAEAEELAKEESEKTGIPFVGLD